MTSIQSVSAAASTQARTRIAETFDNFLTLLTTQLQNQDPLSPMDANEWTKQLVDFTGVEQQMQTNTRLESLISLQTAAANTAAIALMDKTVTANTSTITSDGSGGTWTFRLDKAAARAEVSVRDAQGRVVARRQTAGGTDSQTFAWDGRDATGRIMPPGAYTLAVAAQDEAGSAVSARISVVARVNGVDLSGRQALLETSAGRISYSDVRRISSN
jgi:flagellar basal-body rod modification protein FlgD